MALEMQMSGPGGKGKKKIGGGIGGDCSGDNCPMPIKHQKIRWSKLKTKKVGGTKPVPPVGLPGGENHVNPRIMKDQGVKKTYPGY